MRAEDRRLCYDLLHTDGNETFALRARHTTGTLYLLGDSHVWSTWITVDGLLVIQAKKKKKTEETPEVVANCDQSKEVVTNCDNLVVNEETFSQSDIEKMIITIRGMQVMIDRDLARVYKVTTSQLNQQVKRNIARFPANFRFLFYSLKSDQRNRPLLCYKIAAVLILFSKVSLMYALMVNPAWRANIAICR